METYIPHREGIIQTIVSHSLTQYQAYASPSETILDRLEQFTACADWTKGVARIRCEDCGHSYFRPFSCKVFHLCPSCDQKRTLLYAEYLAEDLLLDLPHRQFVFTIPKILRPYFKSDKRLFGEVSKLIFSLLSDFFPWQLVKDYYVPVLSATSPLGSLPDSTPTGMSWFWKVDLPRTIALYICPSEQTKVCSKSGKLRFFRYFFAKS